MSKLPDFEAMTSPGKSFWIIDDTNRTYDKRDLIKSWGGYWLNDFKSWVIDDPCERAIKDLGLNGLGLQFRKLI